ncbi:MAG: cupin domain-containing protein [Acidobacteria bacterium]|nr:cupin domain-containing protein [Acidobacteriota bacterium]
MRVRISIVALPLMLMPVSTCSDGPRPTTRNPPARHVVVAPEQLVWKFIIPGAEMAVVSGDPDKKGGMYVIRIRTKGEVTVPPHWHPREEHVTVLEGSFLMAHGDKYDASKLSELKAGAHSVVPAKMPHFGFHKAGNVIEVFGEAPFVINWVNPEDDPKRAQAK